MDSGPGTTPTKPTIAITMGDPGGIGPEVVVKALGSPGVRGRATYRIFGSADALHEAAQEAGIDPFWWRIEQGSDLIETCRVHDVLLLDYGGRFQSGLGPTRAGGEASFRYVTDAIAAAALPPGDARSVGAIVTAPISKRAWSLAGKGRYPGHTDLLASRLGAKRWAMMFDSPVLRVVLATAHVALMDVRNVLTIGRIFDAIDLGHEACRRLGVPRPRIAVCGLNPHASEEGLLGDEEERLIAPAIDLARNAGLDASGPHPADTVFAKARRAPGSKFDMVVAMYHDQGLIPVKLLAWESAVNVTLGLPVIRTSPDHGTAFDIAGQNRADARSMTAAIELAARMAQPVGSALV